MLDRLAGRISGMLDLSDEQEVELEEITERFRQELSDIGAPPPEVENLRDRMREARRAGDDARARELRAQLDELRGERMAAHTEVAAEYLEEVETILHQDQLERFQQFRERFAQAGPAGARVRGLHRLIPELPDRLQFSEAQRARYDELVTELRESQRHGPDHWRRMGQLRGGLEEAEQAGDTARAEEIRRQMEASRVAGRSAMESFMDKLDEMLTAEQRAQLAELRQEMGPQMRARRGGDVPGMLQAVRRLEVTSEQHTRIGELSQRAMQEWRQLDRRDQTARTELTQRTKADILALLTAAQAEQFEQILADDGRPGRPGRPGRGEGRGLEGGRRGGRGGGGGPGWEGP
jgi:Spy/CpxP family protein refolding chaperone